MNRQRGRFIVVEGLEGAGKSTAMKTLQQFLQKRLPKVVLAREPGGTRVGEAVRTLVKEHLHLDNRTELLLLYAARVQLIQEIIEPALQQGHWVLCDRFELSTLAYQGGGRQMDNMLIKTLSTACLQGFKPDLTFFLDISPEKGLERAGKRGQLDRIECESDIFFQRVHKAYQVAAAQDDTLVRIDAEQPWSLVQTVLLHHLERFVTCHVSS